MAPKTATGLLSPPPSQQPSLNDDDSLRFPDPSRSLISPPPEETLRHASRYSSAATELSSPPAQPKRKRSNAPTAPRPESISRTTSTASAQSIDLTPNPKPRKQSRQSAMTIKSIAAESPTRSRAPPLKSPRKPNLLLPQSPHADNPSADFILPTHPVRRARQSVTPVPYEPPSERFTPPREVTISPPLGSYNRSSQRTKKFTTEKKIKVLSIKREPPEIDLTLPLPPPSPTDDPLLLSGTKRVRKPKKNTRASAAFQSTRDRLVAEALALNSVITVSSSSPESRISDWDHQAVISSSSSLSPVIGADGTTKNWEFAPVPLTSSSPGNETLPSDVVWQPDIVPLTSSPEQRHGVMPTFEQALATEYNNLNQYDGGWSSEDGSGSEGEGEYTGHFRTMYVPTKQDPPTSVTKSRMDEWGRPISPFPRKNGLATIHSDDMEVEDVVPTVSASVDASKPDTSCDESDHLDDVHEEDFSLNDDDILSQEEAEEDISMQDQSYQRDDDDVDEQFIEQPEPADPQQESSHDMDIPSDDDDDEAEEEAFVDRELSKEPEGENKSGVTEDSEEEGDDTIDVSQALLTPSRPGIDDSIDAEVEPQEADILADLDNDNAMQPDLPVRTPSPPVFATNKPVFLGPVEVSESTPSLLSQQLTARRQSAAPSPSSRHERSPSIVELSPPRTRIQFPNMPTSPRNDEELLLSHEEDRPAMLVLDDDDDDDSDAGSCGSNESMIKITSDNPRAAARAAAILKQYDYECYTKLALKKHQSEQRRSRSTSFETFSRDARRRGLSEAGIRKSTSRSPRKQRQSLGGVIGDQVFMPGSPVTTLPSLLREAEDSLRMEHAPMTPATSLLRAAGRRSLDRFTTPDPQHKSIDQRPDLDELIANGHDRRGNGEWTKDDWKLLDACFTDERLAAGSRMGLGEGELAEVDNVEMEDVVRRFAEICGLNLSNGSNDEEVDKVWSFAGVSKRARALQRKQRSGNYAAPTERFSMTPALSLSASPPIRVPDFTPLGNANATKLIRRPILPPPVEDAPFKNMGSAGSNKVPSVLLAPRYSHLLHEAIAISSPSKTPPLSNEDEEDENEVDQSLDGSFEDDEPSGASYEDSIDVDEVPEETRASPGIGNRVKGFFFSYLPTLSKNNSNGAASKIPKPSSRRGLPLPPKELLNKPRGPVNTPARPPVPKAPAPKDLVHLNAAPVPVENKKSRLPIKQQPQRLVDLHPVTPKPSEPIFVPRPRRSSGGSVKDLVKGFEAMEEEKRGSMKTGTLKELRKMRSLNGTLRKPPAAGASNATASSQSRPIWK